jgi:pantothenate kinase type III
MAACVMRAACPQQALLPVPSDIAEAIDRRAVSGGVADSHTPIGRVRIASVRSPDALAEFVAECRDLFSLDPQVARVVQGHAGVTIRYPDPSRLGVDRWLAMLAANAASSKACLVVDCGTALTVDKLNALGATLRWLYPARACAYAAQP